MKRRSHSAAVLLMLAACADAPRPPRDAHGLETKGLRITLAALEATTPNRDKRVELKEDGTVIVDGKATATIVDNHVDSTTGAPMLSIAANGRLVGNGVGPGFAFDGDDLVTDAGAKLSVGEDGAITVTKDRATETIAKVEGGRSAKRAALLITILWLRIPMYATTDTSKADTPANTRRSVAPPLPVAVSPSGSVDVSVVADRGAATDDVVSFGLPFPQGVLTNESLLSLRNAAGDRVPISTTLLARWPADGSIRSVLVAFKTTLAAGAKERWKLDYGGAPGPHSSAALAPNPDGPVVAVLAADWYAKSWVGGVVLPASANERFASYERLLAQAFARLDLEKAGVDCPATSAHRTYYDGPHAQYEWFFRTGDPARYRSARKEALWYREHEVTFYDGRKTAVQSCQNDGWKPNVPIAWSVLRRMASQGSLDDFLITGDPSAREVVFAFGEAYRKNLPALTFEDRPSIEATERNLGWTMMGLASYYALDSRPEVKGALVSLVDRAIAWQNRGASGGLEHDVHRVDPTECEVGPNGASPFMTSLVVDGMMDYWLLTGDTAKVEPFVRKIARWYETRAITSDKKAFRYLWNCENDAYDHSDMAYLNLLIGHVFGAAYVLTRDVHWLDFGDALADSGLDHFNARKPKEWNQAARSFGRYLGYRAYGKAP